MFGRPGRTPTNAPFQYGTAGFRYPSECLRGGPAVRVGALAASLSLCEGAHCAVILTASHNPAPDNGFKVLSGSGQMMPVSVEPLATRVANAQDDEEVWQALRLLVGHEEECRGARVLVGRDTRPSGEELQADVCRGVELLGEDCVAVCFPGPVTTPEVHFCVAYLNERHLPLDQASLQEAQQAFRSSLIEGYKSLCGPAGGQVNSTIDTLVVDASHGVGAMLMQDLVQELSPYIRVELCNTGGEDSRCLNNGCGAEFCHKEEQWPSSMNSQELRDGLKINGCSTVVASLDGDADRVVFLAGDDACPFVLGGDQIAVLFAQFIGQALAEGPPCDLSCALVHTAYMNGAAKKFIQDMPNPLPTFCTPTGVKFLHAKAVEFDIAVYFEPNGHGTVHFSGRASEWLKKNSASSSRVAQVAALSGLLNQHTGCAVADTLAVLGILQVTGTSLEQWRALYTPRSYALRRVEVTDRSECTVSEDEQTVLTPAPLADAIERILLSESPDVRAFVRPSGTENVVRVYAEAPDQSTTDRIAETLCQACEEYLVH